MQGNFELFYVDAFTREAFSGNPAAVCRLFAPLSEHLMQKIASEVNLSETAFVSSFNQTDTYNLRWFTPTNEVDLCGHATLAAAHRLWESGEVQVDEIQFKSKSGNLTAKRNQQLITLDFPTDPPTESLKDKQKLQEILGINELIYVGKSSRDYLVEVAGEEELALVTPNLQQLAALDIRGLIVTTGPTKSYNFISRCFYPSLGINEDPVTGSAHCALTPYWSKKLGLPKLKAYQASKRGGYLLLEDANERIFITGEAISTIKAKLLLPLADLSPANS